MAGFTRLVAKKPSISSFEQALVPLRQTSGLATASGVTAPTFIAKAIGYVEVHFGPLLRCSRLQRLVTGHQMSWRSIYQH